MKEATRAILEEILDRPMEVANRSIVEASIALELADLVAEVRALREAWENHPPAQYDTATVEALINKTLDTPIAAYPRVEPDGTIVSNTTNDVRPKPDLSHVRLSDANVLKGL